MVRRHATGNFRGAALVAFALLGSVAARNVAGQPPDHVAAPQQPVLKERIEQRTRERTEQYTDAGFTVVAKAPFIVLGNEPSADVRRRAEGTVTWAYDRLRQEFFDKTPDHPVELWLLKDKASYELICQQEFGMRPSTPFGFYLPRRRAVITNINTGAGTLVHEMVHPLIEVNFPDCPAWFNEGLASLYEQCREKDGRIWGLPNWRLRRLQFVVRRGELASASELFGYDRDTFYNDASAMNYAQARYLCLYLQERGKLREFYHGFRDRLADEPAVARQAAIDLLCDALEESDMMKVEAQWQEFVLGLSF